MSALGFLAVFAAGLIPAGFFAVFVMCRPHGDWHPFQQGLLFFTFAFPLLALAWYALKYVAHQTGLVETGPPIVWLVIFPLWCFWVPGAAWWTVRRLTRNR